MGSQTEGEYSVLTPNRICTLCNNRFQTEPLYHVHTPCYYVKYGIPKPTERSSKTNKKKVYRCFWGTDCKETFGSINTLRRHVVYHLTRTFKCKHCTFEGYTKRDIDRHMLIHSDKKQYKCQFCDKEFRYEQILKEHQRRHLGLKTHMCEWADCGRSFVTSSGLRDHLRRHEKNQAKAAATMKSLTSGPPMRCKLCSRLFSQRPELEKHMQTGAHPAFSERKKYKTFQQNFEERCLSCDKTFSNQESLVAHRPCYFQNSQLVDSPTTAFNCDFCGPAEVKPYVGFDNLLTHLASHFPKQLMYQCLICKTTFSEESNILDHVEFDHCSSSSSDQVKYEVSDLNTDKTGSATAATLERFSIARKLATYKVVEAPSSIPSAL